MIRELNIVVFFFLSCSCKSGWKLNNDENLDITLFLNDEVTFQMRENRTTDVKLYWLNEEECDNIELISEEYVSDFNFWNKGGVGGTVFFSFLSTNVGVDTLIIGKRESQFEFSEDQKHLTSDYKIIIRITETE